MLGSRILSGGALTVASAVHVPNLAAAEKKAGELRRFGVTQMETVALDGGDITWSHRHGKGTVALRGAATELLLAMTRRVSLADTGIEVFGDDSAWQKWLDRTPL